MDWISTTKELWFSAEHLKTCGRHEQREQGIIITMTRVYHGFLYSPHCLDGGNKNVWLFLKVSQSLDENIYSWMSISIKGSSLLDSGKFNRE